MPDNPTGLTRSPLPWQSPLIDVELSFNLPDGTPVKTRAQAQMSEPWTIYHLQEALQDEQAAFIADLAFALSSARAGLTRADTIADTAGAALTTPDVGARSSAGSAIAQLGQLLGIIQSLSARVNLLSAALAQATLPARPPRPANLAPLASLSLAPPAPRPALLFVQDTLANRPAVTGYNDGTILFYATDTMEFYVIVAAAWVAVSALPTGPAGGDLAGTYPNPTLVPTAVTPATYGDATHVAQVTFDAKGRAISAVDVPITATATPGGADTDIQFNNSGALDGSADLTWNGSVLGVNGGVSADAVEGATSVSVGAGGVFNAGANVGVTETLAAAIAGGRHVVGGIIVP